MATYNKIKAGGTNVAQLQDEVNQNAIIIPALMSTTSDGDDLTLEFTADLSGAEETELDSVIAAHTPAPQLIEITQLPFSDLEGEHLAVHPSYKPFVEGHTTYAVWCGAGDEVDGSNDLVDDGEIGGGPIIHLDCTTSDAVKEITAKFHPQNGRIWLHEAYIKFTGAPEKAYLSGGIIAMATPLQQSVNLDLVVAGGNGAISFAPGGPGTGTDGFADPDKIVLVPRTFSHDGDWNYDATNGLVPAAGDGGYKMYNVDTLAHRFVNRIPCFDSSPYFSITSDETTELPKHYYVRVCAKTTDGTNFAQDWHASVILEIYRESTYRNV
jgi:hypothetical protein